MKRLHVMTLAYNDFNMVHRSIVQFEQQRPDYEIHTKTLVDQRYPNVESQLENSKKLMDLAAFYGWNYCKPTKNHGCHNGWNWVINDLALGEGDILFGNDPDCNPLQKKYLDASMDVFNNAPETFTVQLNRPEVDKMGLPRTERRIGNTSVYEYHQLIAWSVGSFDCGWLRRIGGMKGGHPLYGWTEHATEREMKRFGAKWYIIKDFYDDHLKSSDPKFIEWKLAAVEQKTQLQFEDWLKEQAGAP